MGRPRWGKRHFRARAACRDFLLFCNRHGLKAFFLTLTSSKQSEAGSLRTDWQALRKRLARRLGLEPSGVLYCGVDTTEGCGVLHLLVAVPQGRGGSSRFLVSAEWMREAWDEIRSARQLRIVPVRAGEGSARKLSRYIVSQYIAGQDALVRLSRSRLDGCSAKLRGAFRRLVLGDPARYRLIPEMDDRDERVRLMRAVSWHTFRVGWESIVVRGHACVFGRDVILNLTGEFEYV